MFVVSSRVAPPFATPARSERLARRLYALEVRCRALVVVVVATLIALVVVASWRDTT